MTIELKVPAAGESITEVVVAAWLKDEGAFVNKDEPVALIETDKANVELPAPAAGKLTRILKKPGEVARVGEVIAMFEAGAAPAFSISDAESTRSEGSRPTEVARGTVPREPSRESAARPAPRPTATPPPGAEDPDATRIERKQTGSVAGAAPVQTVQAPPQSAQSAQSAPGPRAPSLSVVDPDATRIERRPPAPPGRPELTRAEPAGPTLSPSKRRAQRETRDNGEHDGAEAAPKDRGSAEAATIDIRPPSEVHAPVPAPQQNGARNQKTVPMTPMRKRVAERLLKAQSDAALLTTFNEVEMSAVIALRKQHGESFKERHGVKLGFMSFFVKAVVEGLREYTAINAEIRGTDIIYHEYFDIGVAVGGGKGLVVPIIRNAEKKGFAELEKEIADFAERAKNGRLKVEELQGGTFTISNGGVYGSMMSTPIINPPQSGILGMHAIQERPVARNGAVVIAPMMYISLTYDHRIVDGREAVSFLVRVKECVENPARLLLEV